jgi:hypothetical protein
MLLALSESPGVGFARAFDRQSSYAKPFPPNWDGSQKRVGSLRMIVPVRSGRWRFDVYVTFRLKPRCAAP